CCSDHSGTARLPAFPTRRSSDLGQLTTQQLLVGPQRGSTILIVGLDTPVGAAQIDAAEADRRAAMAGGRTLPADATRLRVDRHQDRKSTRLNSSHVKISYAVFCL